MAETDLEKQRLPSGGHVRLSEEEDHHSSTSHTEVGHESKNTDTHSRSGSFESPEKQGQGTFVVKWDGNDDPENPKNWSLSYRIWYSLLSAILILNSTFASSAPNEIKVEMQDYFGFSAEVATLTISLWVAGYCLGPLIWGPMSERIGRMPVFYISTFMYTIWNIACALSQNTASILIFRFLGGTFGAAPLTNSGGTIADLWDVQHRGIAMTIFSVSPFMGPALGVLVSGAITVSGASWRWAYWACAIFSGVCLLLVIVTLRETYEPVILTNKAKRLRSQTGDDSIRSPLEGDPIVLKQFLHRTLLFPFILLAQEPILLVLGVYMSFIYGIIYLSLGAFPIIFQQEHGFNPLIGGVAFLSIPLGGITGAIIYIIFYNPKYIRILKQHQTEGKGTVPPEERLPLLCIAAPLLVVSLFWLGWTHYKSISYWSPLFAGGLLGMSILSIFLSLFNYIIDAYTVKAASALAGNTIMRSTFGAGFPLFTAQMFHTLGTSWAFSLLGFIALVMVPVPFVLIKYGPRIRGYSAHAS